MSKVLGLARLLRLELSGRIREQFDKELSMQIDLVQKVIDIEEEIQRHIQLPC